MKIENVSVSKANVIGLYRIKGIVQGNWMEALTSEEKVYRNLFDENDEYNPKELEYCIRKLSDAYRSWSRGENL